MLLTCEFVNDIQRFSRGHKLSILLWALFLRIDILYLILSCSFILYWLHGYDMAGANSHMLRDDNIPPASRQLATSSTAC